MVFLKSLRSTSLQEFISTHISIVTPLAMLVISYQPTLTRTHLHCQPAHYYSLAISYLATNLQMTLYWLLPMSL